MYLKCMTLPFTKLGTAFIYKNTEYFVMIFLDYFVNGYCKSISTHFFVLNLPRWISVFSKSLMYIIMNKERALTPSCSSPLVTWCSVEACSFELNALFPPISRSPSIQVASSPRLLKFLQEWFFLHFFRVFFEVLMYKHYFRYALFSHFSHVPRKKFYNIDR